MRRRPCSRALSPSTLALLIALGCAGCVPRFAYVVDSNDDSVSVYAVDNAAGRLRSLGYQPTGANPRGIAFRMDGRFAYVVNAGGAGVGSVSAYAVDAATGTLTRLDADSASPGNQDFPAGPSSRGLAIRGDFLYVANFGIVPGATGSVSTFAIDATSGMLTPIAGLPIGAGINPIGIVSNGTFVYVLNSGNPDAGLIGRRPGISAYTVVGTGTLTRIDATPASPAVDDFETSRTPEAIALRHDGNGIVVANGDLGTISVYNIDAASGALSRVDADATTAGVQDFAIGSNPRALASANGFVYAANRAAALTGTLATFRASPGALAHVDANPATVAVDDLPVGTTPAAVGIATSTRSCGWFGVCYGNDFVYVANSGSHDIHTVSTDDFATGAMSAKHDAPSVVGRRGPVAIATVSGRSAVAIAARRAFVSHAGAAAEGVVWSYDVNPSTGALTPISTAHQGPFGVFAGRPSSIAATADGRFVFAGRSTDGRLDGYSVNPATGVLGGAGSVTGNSRNEPNQWTQVLIDPSQRFMYYATDVGDGTWGFSIDATSGALTALPGSPYYMRPSLAMHPSGRFLYGFTRSFLGHRSLHGCSNVHGRNCKNWGALTLRVLRSILADASCISREMSRSLPNSIAQELLRIGSMHVPARRSKSIGILPRPRWSFSKPLVSPRVEWSRASAGTISVRWRKLQGSHLGVPHRFCLRRVEPGRCLFIDDEVRCLRDRIFPVVQCRANGTVSLCAGDERRHLRVPNRFRERHPLADRHRPRHTRETGLSIELPPDGDRILVGDKVTGVPLTALGLANWLAHGPTNGRHRMFVAGDFDRQIREPLFARVAKKAKAKRTARTRSTMPPATSDPATRPLT